MTYAPKMSHLLFCLLLVAAVGCGDSAQDLADGVSEMRQAGEATPESSAYEDDDATLWLGDNKYDLTVTACDFSGETDDRIQTLSARGDTPEGPLQLTASRQQVEGMDMLMHTVSVSFGESEEIMRGGGRTLQAQRLNTGQGWTSMRGGPAEPLIQIEGDRLAAEGHFGDPEDVQSETVDGRLEATCSR